MTAQKSLIYLIWCSLHDVMPDESQLDGTDFEKVLNISASHKITALVDLAVHGLGSNVINDDLKAEFHRRRLLTQRKNILFEVEKKDILDMLEKNKIWYLMLKGSIISACWSQPEIREHADIDILFDSTRAVQVRKLMTEKGYHTDEFGLCHHDTYTKKPFYNFEMHRELFSSEHDKIYDYYKDIQKKMIPVRPGSLEYRLSNEDFYIYFIAHAAKHMKIGGTGLRTLIDIYLYIQNTPLDFSYIRKELLRMGIAEDEKKFKDIAKKLFSFESGGIFPSLSDDEKKLLRFIFKSGAYGTIEHKVKTELSNAFPNGQHTTTKKFKYLIKRIFIVPPVYQKKYPKLYHNRLTRPLINIIRFRNGITVKRKELISEFKTIIKINK